MLNEPETDRLREDAKRRVKQCAENLDEQGNDGVLLERAIEVAKVEALLSISGELELIRKHLQNHGLKPEPSTD